MKLNEMPKEELELLSYTKIAELYLKENNVHLTTSNLFKEVCKLLNLSDSEFQDKMVDFFQSLTTSKDFILLEDGKWDLKAHHAVKIEIEDIYEDEDEDLEKPSELDSDLETEEESSEEIEYDSVSNDDDFEEDDLEELSIVEENDLEEE